MDYNISNENGNMDNREWTTRINKIPTQDDLNAINKIVAELKVERNLKVITTQFILKVESKKIILFQKELC